MLSFFVTLSRGKRDSQSERGMAKETTENEDDKNDIVYLSIYAGTEWHNAHNR